MTALGRGTIGLTAVLIGFAMGALASGVASAYDNEGTVFCKCMRLRSDQLEPTGQERRPLLSSTTAMEVATIWLLTILVLAGLMVTPPSGARSLATYAFQLSLI